MFDLDEDISDENKTEEIELNCPWTKTVHSGAGHDFLITKIRWSFQHPFWLTANTYPIDKPAHPIILDIKRATLALQNLSSFWMSIWKIQIFMLLNTIFIFNEN